MNVKRRLVDGLLSILCFTLMIFNMTYYTWLYLRYDVDVEGSPYVPMDQLIPKLSLCFDLNYLTANQSTLLLDYYQPFSHNKTPEQVFRAVPTIDSVIQACRVLDASTFHHLEASNPTDCGKLFHLTRYTYYNLMCYLFDVKNNTKFSFFHLANAYHDRHLFSISLSDKLKRPVFPILHYDERILNELAFNQQIFPSTYNEMYFLSYDVYEVHSLPLPYVSNCQRETKVQCLNNCWIEEYRQRKLHVDWNYEESTHNQSEKQLRPINGSSEYALIDDICQKKCQWDACLQELVKTVHSPPLPSKEKFLIHLQPLNKPVNKVVYEPRILLADFATSCLAVACYWVDFSVFTVLMRKSSHNSSVAKSVLLLQRKFHRVIDLHWRRFVAINSRSGRGRDTLNKQNIRSILSLSFNVAVFSLFIWQVYNVLHSWFQYKIRSEVTFELNPIVVPPKVAICVRVKEILGKMKNVDIYEDNYDEILQSSDKSIPSTLAGVFEATDEINLLHKCRFRNSSHPFYQALLLDQLNCLKYMNATSFYYNGEICYNFSPIKFTTQKKYSSDFRLSNAFPGMLYSIILNPIAKSFELIRVAAHFNPFFPIQSLEYAEISSRTDENRTQVVSYAQRTVQLLPAPYETKCNPSPSYYAARCRSKCYLRSFQGMHLLPFPAVMSKKRNIKILSYTDLLNETINNQWITIENECDRECFSESCNRRSTQTFLSDPVEPRDHEVEFIIDLFDVPSMKSKYLPVITMGDLLFQLISSFNFFTGLTLSHIFSLINLKKLRKNCFLRYAISHLQINIARANNLLNIKGDPCHRSICIKLPHFSSSSSSKKFLLARRVFVYSTCFIGSVSHICMSITNYMQYPTILETSRDLESSRSYSFTICLDWLNMPSITNSEQLLTVDRVFRLTPPAHHFISDCAYWGLSSRLFNDLTVVSDRILFTQNNSAICNKLFKVAKFLRHNYMCYRVQPIKQNNWTRSQINNVFLDQKVLFMISVKNSLLTDTYRVAVSMLGSYPVLSMMWSPLVTRTWSNLWFTVDYHRFTIDSLAPPYSDGGFTQIMLYLCIEVCVKDKYSKLNITYGGYYLNESDTRVAPYASSTSIIDHEVMQKFEKRCRQMCKVENCLAAEFPVYDYTATKIDSGTLDPRMTDHKNPMSAFYVMSTNTPIDRTVFKVKVSLFELVITVGNIIGIWFGLSVVQMNPFANRIHQFTPQHVTTLNHKIDLLQLNLLRSNK